MNSTVSSYHTRYHEDVAIGDPLPTSIHYPKHNDPKYPYPITGVKIKNDSDNFDLLLLDENRHGPHAEKHAKRIKAGYFAYIRDDVKDSPVGMCYKIKFVAPLCLKKDCDGNIVTPKKGFSLEEEYLKNC